MTSFMVSIVENATATDCLQTNAVSVVSDIRKGRWRARIEEIRTRYAAELAATGDHAASKLIIAPLKKALPGVLLTGPHKLLQGI